MARKTQTTKKPRAELKVKDNTEKKISETVATKKTAQPKTRVRAKKSITQPRNTSHNSEFIPRPLVILSIHNINIDNLGRICNSIQQQKNNSNVSYLLNVFISNKSDKTYYNNMLKDLLGDNPNIYIEFHNIELLHINNVVATLKNIQSYEYNVFIHITVDYIYKTNYIEDILAHYQKSRKDILYIDAKNQVLNNTITKNNENYAGHNYIFSKKALDVLIKNESADLHLWQQVWSEHKMKLQKIKIDSIIKQSYSSIIDGNLDDTRHKPEIDDHRTDNTDGEYWKFYQYLEDNNFTICIFEHNFWSSYIYLNKRNNRMYNIYNDDHGAFEISDDSQIVIKWDTWGEEIFYKKYHDNGNYYYSIHR